MTTFPTAGVRGAACDQDDPRPQEPNQLRTVTCEVERPHGRHLAGTVDGELRRDAPADHDRLSPRAGGRPTLDQHLVATGPGDGVGARGVGHDVGERHAALVDRPDRLRRWCASAGSDGPAPGAARTTATPMTTAALVRRDPIDPAFP